MNDRGMNQHGMNDGEIPDDGIALAPARTREHAWRDMLDLFESDAAESDAAAEAEPVEPWLPPRDLGPLPASLAGRAHDVLAAQRDRAARLRVELTTVRSHLDALARIPADGVETAVYLDRNG